MSVKSEASRASAVALKLGAWGAVRSEANVFTIFVACGPLRQVSFGVAVLVLVRVGEKDGKGFARAPETKPARKTADICIMVYLSNGVWWLD